jgi:hypothetical protein
MMATKQQPKTLLNSKVLFWLKNLHFYFAKSTVEGKELERTKIGKKKKNWCTVCCLKSDDL